MFTGLIEEMGEVVSLDTSQKGTDLTVRGPLVVSDVKLGDSIAVEGVCLTVTAFDSEKATFGIAPETLRRTGLGKLKEGDRVNLERALLPTTRLGGHYVQGHVDGTGRLRSIEEDGDSLWITIDAPRELLCYIVEKAYITVDGASLTVTAVDGESFSVMLVRHTQALITLPTKKLGATINLEADIMAKFAEKILKEQSR